MFDAYINPCVSAEALRFLLLWQERAAILTAVKGPGEDRCIELVLDGETMGNVTRNTMKIDEICPF
jgi:hypothetical protein